MNKLKTSLLGYSKNDVDRYTKELEQNYKIEIELIQKEYDAKKEVLKKEIEELERKLKI